jgi:hypothetical protein
MRYVIDDSHVSDAVHVYVDGDARLVLALG